MPGMTPAQVNKFRKTMESNFLVDTCDIYFKTTIPDGTGAGTIQWVLLSGNVPCRFEELAFRANQIDAYAGAEYLSIIYKVYFKFDQANIKPDIRIYFKSKWYESRVFDLSMTDNIYKKIHVVEILNVRN